MYCNPTGYKILKYRCLLTNEDLPQNRKPKDGKDTIFRDLDCAVIQQIHDYNRETQKADFDSVRGVFTEGGAVYEGSAFCEKTHIQICICNPNCIKGYFKPLSQDSNYSMP